MARFGRQFEARLRDGIVDAATPALDRIFDATEDEEALTRGRGRWCDRAVVSSTVTASDDEVWCVACETTA